jgi:diguanylate cyclase (GGDEF)-like protein/putative nucleotidyltransferase with HDIG domain
VSLAGLLTVAMAALAYGASAPSLEQLAGVIALLVASIVVEAFPVPVDGVSAGGVSLAAVFIVGTALIYGWAPAVALAFLTRAVVELIQRRPIDRLFYNSSVYALAGAAAGVLTRIATGESTSFLILDVLIGSAAFYVTNVALVALVVSGATAEPLVPVLRRSVYLTAVPFSIMASVSLMLAVLWDRSPVLSAALVGPLVAIGLYQRSVHRALQAMKLALTDPLTGLGNHRHFHERLQRELDEAQARGDSLALCLLDIDDFKAINDRYGHPAGDAVLTQMAAQLRQGGEAFRLGGDEFAILLIGRERHDAFTIAQAVVDRIGAADLTPTGPVSVSAGVATYPQHGLDRSSLVRVADSALYLAKEHGKGRVRLYTPDIVELSDLRRLAQGPDRAARLRAAASLAHAVDVRDAYTGSHSYTVGELAARVARRMGLPSEDVELARLAGTLHDLGKLAIPEEVLRKPGPLNDAERLVLERHPQIGFRMLDSLGVEPVATWVRHHHERWDGSGYPDRLGGDAIPLGARILFVADAYDAMTTDRVYRGRLSHKRALAELERCAGTQFDPDVVAAFRAELADDGEAALAVAESA